MRRLGWKQNLGIFSSLGLVIILSYQNCAPVRITPVEDGASTKLTDPATVAAQIDPVILVPRDTQGHEMPPPRIGWTYPGNEPNTAKFYRDLCRHAQLKHALGLTDGSSYHNSVGASVLSGSDLVGVYNHAGATLLAASKIETLVNEFGAMIVWNNNPSAIGSIGSVKNFVGATILCGMSAAKIEARIGAVIVVDADAGDVSNLLGAVVVIGGKISGTISNLIGAVVEIP